MRKFYSMFLFSGLILLLILKINAQVQEYCNFNVFEIIELVFDFEVNGNGSNVDSIDFWKAPDSTESLMFVTAKSNSLVEVWKFPFIGNEQPSLTHSTFSGSNVNGIVVDQESDRLYIAVGTPSSTVSVFSLPDLNFLMNFNKPGVDYGIEPNLALLKLPNNEKRIYVSADDIVYIHDASTGNYIDEFIPEIGLETMAADEYYQAIYIPDENGRSGIYAYNPDGTQYLNNGTNHFAQNVFDSDAEGIIIYKCLTPEGEDMGDGFIVVSDQIESLNEYEFFDRASWEYLGKMTIDGVSNTDGIGSFPQALPDYPLGLFAAINNDGSTIGVGWDDIFAVITAVDVELINFYALNEANNILLNWSTATETNNKGFEILRYENGKYKVIGFVAGQGNSITKSDYTFRDNNLNSGTFRYKLKQIDYDGSIEEFGPIEVFIDQPENLELSNIYPNPFNSETRIQFRINNPDDVRLEIFNILGSSIKLIEDEFLPAGYYEKSWDGTNENNKPVESGVYIAVLSSNSQILSRKLILLK